MTQTPIEESFEAFLRDKGKGTSGEGGNYRRAVEGELARFYAWCANDRATLEENNRDVVDSWDGIYPDGSETDRKPTIEDITTQYQDNDHNIFRSYARHLRRQGHKPSTAQSYYAYVSSWSGWCVQEGQIPLTRHLANMEGARAPLSSADGTRQTHQDQQEWSPAQRDAIVSILDEQACSALDGLADVDSGGQHANEQAWYQALKACRDRALITLVAYTAVRGAELLRDPSDPRRDGVRWRDVNLADNSFEVLRKVQVRKDASLPEPAIHPLSQYRDVLKPPADNWPLFPTFHSPTVADRVTTELAEAGYSDSEIADIRDRHTRDLFIALEHDILLPSTTTDGLRTRLKQLCETHDIPGLDDGEYLEPHAARRGMGEVLVREEGFAAAARFLDNSEEMVRKHYSHIEAAEQADVVADALSKTDEQVNR